MKLERSWSASDWKGQESTNSCVQTLYVVRPTRLNLDEKLEGECKESWLR